MKKILFVLSALTLLSYGCNRNEDAVDSTRGMQREESRSIENMDDTSEAMPRTSPSDIQRAEDRVEDDAQMEQDRSGQTPGFEKDQHRDSDTMTKPLEDRPDLEDEMEN